MLVRNLHGASNMLLHYARATVHVTGQCGLHEFPVIIILLLLARSMQTYQTLVAMRQLIPVMIMMRVVSAEPLTSSQGLRYCSGSEHADQCRAVVRSAMHIRSHVTRIEFDVRPCFWAEFTTVGFL